MRPSIRQDLLGLTVSAQRDRAAAQLLRQLGCAEQILPLGRREPLVSRGLHVHRDPVGVEPGGQAAGGPDQAPGIRTSADAHGQPIGGRPGFTDALLGHVAAHLGIDPLSRPAQGQLA